MIAHERRLLGHRGACAELPENSMPSFERAVAIGVDVLETDVHLTADGHVVISHDPDGRRAAGVAEAIATSSLEAVRRWDIGWGHRDAQGARPFAGRGLQVPTLDELLGAFPAMRFNVDIKPESPAVVGPVLEVIRRHDASARICLASFSGRVIRAVRRAGFAGETVLAQDEVIALLAAPSLVLDRLRPVGTAVQIPTHQGPLDLASPRFIDKCHRLGYRVDYWTINDPDEADTLLSRGADGLISDDPAALLPVVDRHR